MQKACPCLLALPGKAVGLSKIFGSVLKCGGCGVNSLLQGGCVPALRVSEPDAAAPVSVLQ